MKKLIDKNPSIGDWRNTGMLGCLELVKNRDTKESMASFNASPSEMSIINKVGSELRALGMFTYTRWNYTFVAPPLIANEEEIDEGVPFSGVQPMVADIREQARQYYQDPTNSALFFMPPKSAVQDRFFAAGGGLADIPREGYAEGGIMDLGGMEKDYREEGGFVPIGAKERADDVPARLSKNEFVFTADAVRNAGGCLLYTSPSPRDRQKSRMPSSA